MVKKRVFADEMSTQMHMVRRDSRTEVNGVLKMMPRVVVKPFVDENEERAVVEDDGCTVDVPERASLVRVVERFFVSGSLLIRFRLSHPFCGTPCSSASFFVIQPDRSPG